MILYQRVQLSTGAHIGAPGPLPEHLVGLEAVTLADLPAALSPDTIAQLDLADTGFLPVVIPDPPPPPPPRREIPKSTVLARLQDIGKFDAVWANLGTNAALFAKWFTPDWPNVFFDDPGMLAVFAAAGLSADEIAQVTA